MIYCDAIESNKGGFKKARQARPKSLGRAERTEKYVSTAKGRERRWRLFSTLPKGIKELVELFRPHTNRIMFMHFGPWFMRDVGEGKKKIKPLGDTTLSVETAYDGKEFII